MQRSVSLFRISLSILHFEHLSFRFSAYFVLPIDLTKDLSEKFGSDSTPNGLRFQFTDRIRPLAKRQLALLAAGLDPKDVDVTGKNG